MIGRVMPASRKLDHLFGHRNPEPIATRALERPRATDGALP